MMANETAAKLVSVVTQALASVGVNLHGNEAQLVARDIARFVDTEVELATASVAESYEAAKAETPVPDSGGEPAKTA